MPVGIVVDGARGTKCRSQGIVAVNLAEEMALHRGE